MTQAERAAFLVALALGGLALADETREPPHEHAASAGAPPSLDLLEFLGSWETATGPWNESLPDREPRADAARRSKETHRD